MSSSAGGSVLSCDTPQEGDAQKLPFIFICIYEPIGMRVNTALLQKDSRIRAVSDSDLRRLVSSSRAHALASNRFLISVIFGRDEIVPARRFASLVDDADSRGRNPKLTMASSICSFWVVVIPETLTGGSAAPTS